MHLEADVYASPSCFPESRFILQTDVRALQYQAKPPTMFIYPLTQASLPITVEGSKEASVKRLEAQLRNYANLAEGWDGYDGQPAKTRSVSDAVRLLSLISKSLPLPRAMLSGDGEISFYWESGSDYAELDFPGDGTFYYFYESPEGYVEEDSLPSRPDPEVPQRLAAFLRERFI